MRGAGLSSIARVELELELAHWQILLRFFDSSFLRLKAGPSYSESASMSWVNSIMIVCPSYGVAAFSPPVGGGGGEEEAEEE